MRGTHYLLVVSLVAGHAFAEQAVLNVERQADGVELWRDPASGGTKFGSSLAVVSGRLAIGTADGDAVLLLEPDGRVFERVAQPTATKGSGFGSVLAGEGDRLLIGEPGAGKVAGKVHLVDGTTGKLLSTWEQPGAGAGKQRAEFGKSLLLMGNQVVVGAPYQECPGTKAVGAIFRFNASQNVVPGGACDPHANQAEKFGRTLAYFDNQLLVSGLSEQGGPTGGGLIRVLVSGQPVRSVTEEPPATWGAFGNAMVRVGGRVAVGANSHTPGGIVYLFDPQSWRTVATIERPASSSGFFGSRIVAVGDDLLIGEVDGAVGPARVFLVDSRTGQLKRTFRGPGGFGSSLAVWGDRFVIGAPRLGSAGAVYLFPREGPVEVSVLERKPTEPALAAAGQTQVTASPPPPPPVAAPPPPPPDAARVAEIARCLEPKKVDVKACWELGNTLTKIDGETVVDETTARRAWDRACGAGHCLSCGASRELGGVVNVDLAALEAKNCTVACGAIGSDPETTSRGTDACQLLVEVQLVGHASTAKALAALERACRSTDRCGSFIAAVETSDLVAAEQKRLTTFMKQRCARSQERDRGSVDPSCLVWSRRAELAPVLKGCAAGQGPDCHAAGQLKYEGFTGASGLGEFARGCDLGWGPSCIKVADDERLRGSAVRASELTKKAEGLCDKGQSAACLARASAYFDGELAKGRNKAADDVWRGKAQALERRDCDGGDAVACRRLGEMFRDGTGGEESPTKSMEALKKACDGGDGDGCAMLSWAFTNGRSVPAEPARAVALALRGCSLGSKDSCYKLTSLLSRSDIGEEDRAMGTAALAQQCKLGKACYTP